MPLSPPFTGATTTFHPSLSWRDPVGIIFSRQQYFFPPGLEPGTSHYELITASENHLECYHVEYSRTLHSLILCVLHSSISSSINHFLEL